MLEAPAYTRPASWRGLAVPPVLLSGDHAAIAAWRREQALERTKRVRPDLLG
jgi:tRNA (guanine37-N1)-methyltransferase